VRSFYERVRRGDDERRKIALVATVHYLLRVMLTMLANRRSVEGRVPGSQGGSWKLTDRRSDPG